MDRPTSRQKYLEREFRRGTWLRNQNRFAEAAAIFEHLITKFPEDTGVRIGAASIYFLGEDYVSARRVCMEAIAIAPRSELISIVLFHSLLRLEEYEAAFCEMERYLTLRPDSPEYRDVREEMGLDDTPN
jgi:Flp pilus assembly protein TadD